MRTLTEQRLTEQQVTNRLRDVLAWALNSGAHSIAQRATWALARVRTLSRKDETLLELITVWELTQN